MTKEEYKQLLVLSIYGELTEEEEILLETYMKKHPEVKKEIMQLERMKEKISEHTTSEIHDELLDEARQNLRRKIRSQRTKSVWWERIFHWNILAKPQFRFAAAGLFLFALGMTTSQLVCNSSGIAHQTEFQVVENEEHALPQDLTIANVQFVDGDATDGEVEFRFEATRPMHMKGKIDNPEIQKILTYALLNEENPGVRISSVNLIAQQSEKGVTIDEDIKEALIESMKKDRNPGVRREALRVLVQNQIDTDIRIALLYVLVHDKNTGMRVAAINALDKAKQRGAHFDSSVVSSLKNYITKENNSYVRTKTENLIGEAYQ